MAENTAEVRSSCEQCDGALTLIDSVWRWTGDLTKECYLVADINGWVAHKPRACERCGVFLEDYPTLVYPNEETYDGDAKWCLDCFSGNYSELEDDGPTNADYIRATK